MDLDRVTSIARENSTLILLYVVVIVVVVVFWGGGGRQVKIYHTYLRTILHEHNKKNLGLGATLL